MFMHCCKSQSGPIYKESYELRKSFILGPSVYVFRNVTKYWKWPSLVQTHSRRGFHHSSILTCWCRFCCPKLHVSNVDQMQLNIDIIDFLQLSLRLYFSQNFYQSESDYCELYFWQRLIVSNDPCVGPSFRCMVTSSPEISRMTSSIA